MDAGDLVMVLFTAAATACVVGIALGRQARVPDEAADAGEGRLRGQLESMTAELARMRDVVAVFERDRAAQYGELSGHIAAAGQRTAELAETTRELRQALSSSKARGQWGERMAEDVLRLAGLLEGVNYRRQTAVEGGRSIPDFTFLLPRGLQLHMDVKFPLDNYLHYLSAETDSERAAHKAQFLRDVRARVRELNGRGYIDPETTVDCMLLFIPNEQLYAFIQEQDATILDAALRDRVVLCSPLTLFAVLAVIRQSVDSFAIERRASELLSLLSSFRRQWGKFVDEMDRVGRHLDIAGRSFDDLQGVRRRQLERPLDQLDRLRADALGPAAPAGAGMARLADVDVDENQIALA